MKSHRALHLLWLGGVLLFSGFDVVSSQEIRTVAFGSCFQQDRPQPMWDVVLKRKPDVFIFAGDNIYADTEIDPVFRSKYKQLLEKTGFNSIRRQSIVLATWDDHDYGENDAGAEFHARTISKQAFLEFLGEPKTSPRFTREGVYDSYLFGDKPHRLQIILLDTRSFRTPLTKRVPPPGFVPTKTGTMLGEDQWRWLEHQLRIPAELRLMVSSIQVLPDQHPWEKWANFPHERDRLLSLTKSAGAVLFLSGDRHLGEISTEDRWLEITSSPFEAGIAGSTDEPNRRRIGMTLRERNVGLISIDWPQRKAQLALLTLDNREAVTHEFVWDAPPIEATLKKVEQPPH